MKKTKMYVSFLLVAIVFFGSFTYVSAGTKNVSSTIAGISVRATKKISQGTNSWAAYSDSVSVNGVKIGTIGYTWWTLRQECPVTNTVVANFQYGGSAKYNASSYYGTANVIYKGCVGYKRLKNMGTHDLKNGSSVWRPYVELAETR